MNCNQFPRHETVSDQAHARVTPVKERILGYRQRIKVSDELEAVIVLLHSFPVCHRTDVMP